MEYNSERKRILILLVGKKLLRFLKKGNLYSWIIILFILLFFANCNTKNNNLGDIWEPFQQMKEIQLTYGEKGHFLYVTQVFSPDDQWIVYDTRNDGGHIGQTCCVEMVNIKTKEIKLIYQAPGQTRYGPGVGAASFNPVSDKVLFIHGLFNCDSIHPYGFTRRMGVAVALDRPGAPIFMDARDVSIPFTPGALRGGTHAHSWSGDGEWISFTYNDALLSELEEDGCDSIKDLRVVGVMAPYGPVNVEANESGENFDGEKFTVLVTRVNEYPEPGTDQISRAYEDGWVGTNGYFKQNFSKQKRALAFLGDTKDKRGNTVTEVFIADIPDDITIEIPGEPLAGTASSRPAPPVGTSQRRLTFTSDNKYPGVQGPRHWIRSTPDGSLIFFMMKDEDGNIQLFAVSPNGGEINQITTNLFSIETTFSVCPDGNFVAYGNEEKVFLTHIETGETRQASPGSDNGMTGLGSIQWSNDGKAIAYNRKVEVADTIYYQVFILRL